MGAKSTLLRVSQQFFHSRKQQKEIRSEDQLGKLGSEHLFIGPELACDISMGVAKKTARD
jgi:hypothetical protein